MMHRTRAAVAALALATLVAAMVPARATPAPVVTATYFQYLPGSTPDAVHVLEGTPLLFTHQDPIAASFYTPYHDLVSVDVDEHGEPLFASRLLLFGDADEVQGVADLAPGRYRFVCTQHEADLNMRGELVVLGTSPRTEKRTPGRALLTFPPNA